MRGGVVIVILFFSHLSIGQRTLSVNQALREGLVNNFGIQISEENVLLAKKDEKIFRSSTLPRIDLSLRQNNRYEKDNSPTSFVEGAYTQSGADASIDMDWVLFDGFRAKIEAERLKQISVSTAGETQLLVENTVQAIVLAYYRAVLEQEKRDVIKEVTEQSKERYSQADFEFKSGSKSLFDVLNLKTAWIRDSINYKKQDLVFVLAMDDLRYVIGDRSNEELKLTDRLEIPLKNYQLSELQNNLVSNNQDIKLQYLNLELQALSRKMISADKYPTVSLNSSLNQDLNSSRFADEPREKGSAFGLNAGFRVGFKLFNGGRVKELLRKNKVEERIAHLQIEELEYRLLDELEDAHQQYGFYRDIITSHDELLVVLSQNLDIANERLIGGYSTPLEFRTVQLDYLQSRLEQLETIFELKAIEIGLTRLTGGISRSVF